MSTIHKPPGGRKVKPAAVDRSMPWFIPAGKTMKLKLELYQVLHKEGWVNGEKVRPEPVVTVKRRRRVISE